MNLSPYVNEKKFNKATNGIQFEPLNDVEMITAFNNHDLKIWKYDHIGSSDFAGY